ncbi:hypothetical protein [Neisseria weaveri]|uniref:Uncharacterized protein n=1 Tax=Neisseria weaveri TaxID=28091 RepID=A0A3S4ZDI5_9NEIS|nr:hypothetical protein [Neisseria weaveri]EGV35096.1 hypothetical protein l11_21020 [Neisseria weaveri LMG 5135]EGV36235.1 hypothetical protein l13_09930 [Neisseria weaveri ATCC 51223]SAY51959.1 Uncharacterised protein [Neisseria weaveri]VEJ51376.1 Uncharacterised protein [Neisseria weaveri]
MNKTVFSFSPLLVLASAFAAAESGSPMPKWDHNNDSGTIIGLQEVQYSGVKPTVKEDSRVKFIYPNTEKQTDNGAYQPLRRTESR